MAEQFDEFKRALIEAKLEDMGIELERAGCHYAFIIEYAPKKEETCIHGFKNHEAIQAHRVADSLKDFVNQVIGPEPNKK